MFSERLKKTRKAKGFTAKEMADSIYMSLRNYRKYESGDVRPTIERFVLIADLLDVSADYLLCRDAFLTKHGHAIYKMKQDNKQKSLTSENKDVIFIFYGVNQDEYTNKAV